MEKLPKDQAAWNGIAMFAFAIAFLFAFWVLTDGADRMRWISYITVFDIGIITLATFRLVRLVTYDKIFGFIREWFMDPAPGFEARESRGTCTVGAEGWIKPQGGFRRLMAELIECIWCTGLWAALFATTAYFLDPLGKLFVMILAIAALGSFFQNISKAVAAIAERK